jgi:signal transduction histidine kinase
MYGMISGIAVLLIGFDLTVYHIISRAMFKQFDASLESAAGILSASVEQDDKDKKFDFEFNIERMPEFVAGKTSAYYELWRNDGTPIKKSPSLGSDDLAMFASANKSHTFMSFVMKNGRPVRAVAVNFLPHFEDDSNTANASQTLILIVARDAGNLLAQLRFLKYLLSIVSAGILGLAYAVAEVVVRQGLAPFSAVAAQIDNIRDDNLKNRITGENLPTEIVPIQRQLNGLLQRLETSFERERAFNVNVAHELRTPLAGIQSTIEVCLSRNRQSEEYQAALQTSLQITKSMNRMIDTLLSLAKLESNQITLNYEHISLKNAVADCWQSFANRAYEQKITFENRIAEDAVCFSDKDQLSIILFNLLDNAVEHSNQAGRIWVKAEKSTDFVTLSISNTGCKIKQEDIPNIFDYFWRGDKSRKDTGKHCGIGLAVVQRVTRVLGGTVTAEIEPQEIFTIHLSLPVS